MGRINLIERIGVHKVALIFLEDFGWIEREQTVSDVGIDMQVEIVDNGMPTGQLIALQIKSGPSYFNEKKDGNIIYRGKKAHLEYWLNHSLPVLIALYNPQDNLTLWQKVIPENILETDKGWKTEIPTSQTLKVDFKEEITKFYYNPNHYTVVEVSDTSHGITRRVSAKILVENTFATSKSSMKKMIPQVNENLKRSDYHRDEITKERYRDTPAEVVSIFFYDSILQVDHGLTFCRSVWNASECETPLKMFDPDEQTQDIDIKWDKDSSFFSDFIPEHQTTKGIFLKFSDAAYQQCAEIYNEIKGSYETSIKNEKYDFLITSILKWENQIEKLNDDISNMEFPPFECKEIDELIQAAVIMLHNILIVAKDEKITKDNVAHLVRTYMKEIESKLPFYEYERKKVQ